MAATAASKCRIVLCNLCAGTMGASSALHLRQVGVAQAGGCHIQRRLHRRHLGWEVRSCIIDLVVWHCRVGQVALQQGYQGQCLSSWRKCMVDFAKLGLGKPTMISARESAEQARV